MWIGDLGPDRALWDRVRVTGSPHQIDEIDVTRSSAGDPSGSVTTTYENPDLPFTETVQNERILAVEARNADGEVMNSL